ncbi:MAG: dipeptide epimerase [Candidatus Krumholzibacteria bacterium]|nr:dipeptide epimerase [Candidatus Krumholzibacteria bacterium]
MKITAVRAKLELRHAFRIARSTDEFRESVLVRLKQDDLEGFGEAAPSPRYGQTADSAQKALSSLSGDLLTSTGYIEDILENAREELGPQKAALAGLDIALHDLLGKRLGVPLYTIFGLNPERTPVTSYTIGIDTPEVIEEKVKEAEDFPVLKVKMGLENDHEIMETIRKLTDRPVRIDANEGWTKEEAQDKIHWLESQNVEFIEQPLPAANPDDIRRLAERVSIPLFADESVSGVEDIPQLMGAFDGINIKLMKCGGIREALKLIHTARACGMMVMIGCMIESSIGITAAAHLSPLVDYADLDGNILIRNDPAAGVGTRNGKLVLPEGPGLGVTLKDGPVRNALTDPAR